MVQEPLGGEIAIRARPLRQRLTVLLLLAALVPMLAVGALAALALRGVVNAGAGQGAVALQARARSDFAVSVRHAATLQAQDFLQVQARVQALATSAQYLFEHPDQFPGTQQGNSPLDQASSGAWLSQAGAPVGVFVPATTPTPPSFWAEVNLVSHLDPFMETLQASSGSPALLRLWLITPDGMVRAAPDPGYGHPGSPVTARTNLAQSAAYRDALGGAGGAVWTASPTPDPAGGPADIVSVSVPVRDSAGRVVAVAGADVSVPVIASALGQGLDASSIGLMTAAGRWVAGDPASQAFFAGRGLTGAVAAAERGGTAVAAGPDVVAASALAPPGWVLAAAAPLATVLGPASGLVAAQQAERAVELAAVIGALLVAAAAVWIAAVVARRTTRPLEALASRIHATEADSGVAGGTVDTAALPALAGTGDELALVTHEFDAMRARLHEAAQRIEEAALQRARSEQAAEVARLEDRNALAREVHDKLAQGFVAAQMLAEAADADAGAGDWAAVARRVRRIADVAREGLEQARASVRDLMPAPDLAETLRREAARLEVPVEVAIEGDAAGLPGPVRSALAAIAREALANVARHAHARSAKIVLQCVDGTARLEVADDGVGIRAGGGTGVLVGRDGSAGQQDPAGRDGHVGQDDLRGFGLASMEARAAAVGGRLHIDSRAGVGTTLTVEVALQV